MTSRPLDWLRLLRLPNVLTVPGDLLAGAALAGIPLSHTPLPIAAVSAAYLAGMVLNDRRDLETDRLERPERPLPSGRISPAAASTLCAALALTALGLHPHPAMPLLLAVIAAYHAAKDRLPLAAPLLMGICRGMALWTGAGSPPSLSLPLSAALLTWITFIALLTRLAALENSRVPPGTFPCWIPMALVSGLLLTAFALPRPQALAGIPALVLLLQANHHIRRILRAERVTPPDIGALISLLFPLQATVLTLCGLPLSAAAVWSGQALLRWTRGILPAS